MNTHEITTNNKTKKVDVLNTIYYLEKNILEIGFLLWKLD